MRALPFLGVEAEEKRADRVREVVDLRDRERDGHSGQVDVEAQPGPQRAGAFHAVTPLRDHAGLVVQALDRTTRLAGIEVRQDPVLVGVVRFEELQ